MKQGSTLDISTLMQFFNDGQPKALKDIYDHFKKDLCYFAIKLTNNAPEWEEIVQDSFIKLFRRPSDFPTLSTIKSFLYTTTKNACIDLIRKNQAITNRLGIAVPVSEHEQVFTVDGSMADELCPEGIQTELIRHVTEQVHKLPDRCRQIFIMRYYEGKRVTDIADELQITRASVSKHLGIAITRLRASLVLLACLHFIRSILNFFIK